MSCRHKKNQSHCPACQRPAAERAELLSLISKIQDTVNKDPRKAAVILTEWVRSTPIPSKKKNAA